MPVLNSKKAKLRELRKEIEKLTEQTKSKIKVESERDDTTSSSSDDDEEESDHQRPSPEKKIEVKHTLSCNCLLSRTGIIYSKVSMPSHCCFNPLVPQLLIESPLRKIIANYGNF